MRTTIVDVALYEAGWVAVVTFAARGRIACAAAVPIALTAVHVARVEEPATALLSLARLLGGGESAGEYRFSGRGPAQHHCSGSPTPSPQTWQDTSETSVLDSFSTRGRDVLALLGELTSGAPIIIRAPRSTSRNSRIREASSRALLSRAAGLRTAGVQGVQLRAEAT